jgi:hypothetical protein
MNTNKTSLPRLLVAPGEIICCDVCGERVGTNLTGYVWRTERAICGLCLDDLLNQIGKYFPKLDEVSRRNAMEKGKL